MKKQTDTLIKRMLTAGSIVGVGGFATGLVMCANAVDKSDMLFKQGTITTIASLAALLGPAIYEGVQLAIQVSKEEKMLKEYLKDDCSQDSCHGCQGCECECEEAEEITPTTKHNDGYSYQDYLNSLEK